MKQISVNLILFLGLLAFAQNAQAQATLSIQGVLQNFNGSAVENGQYDITFRLYTTDAGGTALWSETQTVPVTGGVYSVLLGEVNPLNVPFDQPYYVGLTIPGGPEHTPRTRLTAAPYALSMLGQDNKFPSTGMVQMSALATGTETTTATSYTVGDNDHVIYLDHTANQNVTLPAASAANAGRNLMLVNKEAVAKTLTASDYVDLSGATSTTIPANSAVELQSDGSVWRQTGGYVTPTAAPKAYVRAVASGCGNTSGSMNFSSEQADLGDNLSGTTFTAPRTGLYNVSGYSQFAPNSTVSSSQANASTYLNCSGCGGNIWLGFQEVLAGTSYWFGHTFAGNVYMQAGQTFTIRWSAANLPSCNSFNCTVTIAEL